MTEQYGNSVPARSYRFVAIVLTGVIVSYIVFDILAFAALQGPNKSDSLISFVVGAFVFEPIMFALWLVCGAGRLATRSPIVVVSLAVVYVAFGCGMLHAGDLERIDFIGIVIGGTIIFILATLLFWGMRWFTKWQIEPLQSSGARDRAAVSFSMKYLLGLTTLTAVALGMAWQIKFHDPPRHEYFGNDFALYIMIVGGIIVAGVVLPVVAIPLMIFASHISRRARRIAFAFWSLVTLTTILIWVFNQDNPNLEMLAPLFLTQLGAAFVGILTAIALRFTGLRLVRRGAAKSDLRHDVILSG